MQKSIQISLSPDRVMAFGLAAISAVAVLANVSLFHLIPAFWGVVLFASVLPVVFCPVQRKWPRIIWTVFVLAGVITYVLAFNNGWLDKQDVQVGFAVYAGVATFAAWLAVLFEELD
nr:hypothetical protein [Neorhizobium tomejilense]